MIALLLLAALCGIGYASRRRHRAGPGSCELTGRDVGPLSGTGWSMVALNPQDKLRVVDLDDPTVNPATDIALPLRGHDIN